MGRYGDEVGALVAPLIDPSDLDALLDRVGDARVVMLGEASHGTHEFYVWRAAITRRLIEEKAFSFVAVEGDWPGCDRVDRSVHCRPDAPADPRDALLAFERWPTWMWANEEVIDFARWLRACNTTVDEPGRAGFHGLDVYSLWDSLREILTYLREHDPEQVPVALAAYRCFEPYAEDAQRYALVTRFVPASCENEVIELLVGLRRKATADGAGRFGAWQNAEVVAGAERYYRAMLRGGRQSWNVRDRHMDDTLHRLLTRYGPDAKAAIREHNTHVGDAWATDMTGSGKVNIGQLARERYGADRVVLSVSARTDERWWPATRGGALTWGHASAPGPQALARGNPARRGARTGAVRGPTGRPARPAGPSGDRRGLPPKTGVVPQLRADHRYDAFCWFDRQRRGEGMTTWTTATRIAAAAVELDGDLTVPAHAHGLVLFAHGSGSSRHSPRNRAVADALNQRGLATLLIDLLAADEEQVDARTRQARFDIGLLAERLVGIIDWLGEQPETAALSLGLFGASTGAAAALVAASVRPDAVRAVVSRGGRPDLAGPALIDVKAPTLLIVGEQDPDVRKLNEQARNSMTVLAESRIIATARHLFEEPGTLEQVAEQAGDWFGSYLTSAVGR